MNVVLAEAEVPTSCCRDVQINPDFAQTDVVIVVGANDVVNPAATDDPTGPDRRHADPRGEQARRVFVIKRSLSPGLRRHQERAVRARPHRDAVRRRQGGPRRARG
jgi:H+-translocating NAD(P) transhydrogenase subunit beta